MTELNGQLIEDNEQYSFVLSEDKTMLLFNWKHVAGLNANDFRKGISEFAAQCRVQKTASAVIDATSLDQGSPAIAWLRAQDDGAEAEGYVDWWNREVLPVYRDASISSLAVATGDPNAPGEMTDLPADVTFKIGYLPDLKSAMDWATA